MLKLTVFRSLDHSAHFCFGGDTYQNKDAIKALGYKFVMGSKKWSKTIPSADKNMQALLDELRAIDGLLGDLPLCWLGYDITISTAINGVKKSNHLD